MKNPFLGVNEAGSGATRARLRVDLYPEADKLGKQFKYASSLGVAFVAVLGEEEAAKGQVALKDMQSGEQRVVERERG